MDNDKKERVSVKDIKKSSACVNCRNRKKKCDGNTPCSYCLLKDWDCCYTDQKKRGPKKQINAEKRQQQIVAVPNRQEFVMLDKLEAQNFCNLYLKYYNIAVPLTNVDCLMSPSQPAHKVQAYAAMAYAARVTGLHAKATDYISLARLISGDIYDSATPDSVSALLMMANFWRLVIDIPKSVHYYKLASSLCKMVPEGQVELRARTLCDVSRICCDELSSDAKKAKRLKIYATSQMSIITEENRMYIPYYVACLKLAGLTIEAFGKNILYLNSSDSLNYLFHHFDGIHISEEKRSEILNEINAVRCCFYEDMGVHYFTFMTIYTSMHLALVEWKSGRLQEALYNCHLCLNSMSSLESSEALAFTTGIVDYAHVLMFGGLCQFLYEQAHYDTAKQMCKKIKNICSILSPEYDFMLAFVDEFMNLIGEKTSEDKIKYINFCTNINNENNNDNDNNIFQSINFISDSILDDLVIPSEVFSELSKVGPPLEFDENCIVQL